MPRFEVAYTCGSPLILILTYDKAAFLLPDLALHSVQALVGMFRDTARMQAGTGRIESLSTFYPARSCFY